MANKHKAFIFLLMLVLLFSCSTLGCAEDINPYASEEINSASIVLLSSKRLVYNVLLTSQQYSVEVTYCNLYIETDEGWDFVCAMYDAIPNKKKGDLIASFDISDYIETSGKYKVTAGIRSGSTTRSVSTTRTY